METNNTGVDMWPDGISVWFGCQSCTEYAVYFSSVKDFLDHKKNLHFAEFKGIKSVVFEEKMHDDYSVHDFLSHKQGEINRTELASSREIINSVSIPSVEMSSKEPQRQLQPVPVPAPTQICNTDIDEIQNDIFKTEEPEEEFISSPKRELNSDGEFDSDYDMDPLDPDPYPDSRSSPMGNESSHSPTPINTEPLLQPVPMIQKLQSLPIPMQYQPIQLLLLPPNQQQQQRPTNLYGFLTPVTPLNFTNIEPLPLASSSSSLGSGPSNSQSSANIHEINTDSSNLDETCVEIRNERPFKCPFPSCNLAFARKYTLQKHQKRHERVKRNPKVKIHHSSFQFPDSLNDADGSSDLSSTLALKDWLSQLKLKSTKNSDVNPDADAGAKTNAETENVILLDPDPTELTSSLQISSENPITCKLCCAKLESELECKIHATHCWLRNKGSHRYCCLCKKLLSSSLTLQVHNARVHKIANGKFKSFVCEVCGMSFFNLTSLSSHHLVHDKSGAKFKCTQPNCKMGFNNKTHLAQHMLRHSQDRPFKCTEEGCSKSFVLKKELSTHLKSVFHTESQETFQCSEENCDEVCKGSQNLKHHMNRVHGIGDPVAQFTCELCNKSFMWKKSYTNHMAVHAGLRQYKCDIPGCGKTLTRKQALREHKWAHLGERPFQCDTCGMDFTRYVLFHQHFKTHKHESQDEDGESDNLKFSCHICSKKFRYQVNFVRHVEDHKSQYGAKKSLEKIFKCTEPNCEKRFSSKNSMSLHMRGQHSQDRPFKCTEEGCSKSFQTKTQLTSHLKKTLSHTEISKQKSFQCTLDNCGKVCRQNNALKEHMYRVHGIGDVVPQYTCEVCGKCFIRTACFNMHMSMHAGDRQFKCDYEGCDKTFRRKRNFTEHGWEHTGERPFKCGTCGMDFRQSCGYYAHLKSHKKQA